MMLPDFPDVTYDSNKKLFLLNSLAQLLGLDVRVTFARDTGKLFLDLRKMLPEGLETIEVTFNEGASGWFSSIDECVDSVLKKMYAAQKVEFLSSLICGSVSLPISIDLKDEFVWRPFPDIEGLELVLALEGAIHKNEAFYLVKSSFSYDDNDVELVFRSCPKTPSA